MKSKSNKINTKFFEVPDPEKYKQMILAFLQQGGPMSMDKLASFLYLADFNSYYKNLKSMSGMQYRKCKEGAEATYLLRKAK